MKKYILILAVCLSVASCDLFRKPQRHIPQVVFADTLAIDIVERVDTITPDNPEPMLEEMEDSLQSGMRRAMLRSTEVITLPVVVHIIYTGLPTDRSNIPDQQVYSAIEAMNHHYAADAPLTSNSVNTGIQFQLAKRDPQGNPTNGINRVSGDAVPNYKTLGIKTGLSGFGADELLIKNLSRWPVDKYINVWVVTEISGNDGGNGTQGYAYHPLSPARDGIVILHSCFGSTDKNCDGVQDQPVPGFTVKGNMTQGKVLTHEMGHHFGLYHNFQGTTSCTAETNCLVQGDKCCDTPPVKQVSSCTVPACTPTPGQPASTYVFANHYMEYGSQTCLYKFSNDQKLRMLACIHGIRASLKTSPGLSDPFSSEAGISISINGFTCIDETPVQATIVNGGVTPLLSVRINNVNYSTSIAVGGSGIIQLPPLNTSQEGIAEVAYILTHVNGMPDPTNSNNVAIARSERVDGVTITMSFTIDYYGSENSWSIKNSSGVEVWQRSSYPQGVSGAMFANRTYTDTNCLPKGSYTLTMKDSHGDAQNFAAPRAGFKLLNGSTVLVSSGPCWCTPSPCVNTCKEKTWAFVVR